MYKCKLQELCQRKGWNLPEYSTARDGPDHIPRFTAVVNVNGQPFETPNPCKSSKEAQNLVAQIAYDHFVAQTVPFRQHQPSSSLAPHPGAGGAQSVVPIPPWDRPRVSATVPAVVPNAAVPNSEAPSVAVAPVLPTSVPLPLPDVSIPSPPMPPARFFTAKANLDVQPANKEMMQPNNEDNAQTSMINTSQIVFNDKNSKDVLHIYKNRLQEYAQKKGLSLPVYTYESEGPPHDRRFKSIVSLDGKTYEAPAFFSTLKDAEHAAAKVACEALSIVEIREDKGLYKNLLQALAQKRGLKLPSYETSPAGALHKPLFVSTVEIGSDTFRGTEAKSKRQAEVNAAEVAYDALTKIPLDKGALEVSSSLGSTAAHDFKVNVQPTVVLKDENDVENEGEKQKPGKINCKRQKTSD
ncbi:Hypothetical predicted protein [Olea europaea subsp. europaea]|uniref:DRBM domain-containing protein n=1 Tax=Olea europaea subsp. europaea TaxID=158383 RepID=A0A8S0T7U9_OLEEU|nr:Hypothetical predicted protein [Olea europaea subsp. europaea]